ncbi:hypothetical protein HHK36_007625 [Tetracentron sinense]|uniref:TF-B3 domain-containing protein n=1 Tax=Tetracentron sinense TaxID=13715 RepID=A0A834ZS46_TETSI|nr:hypothetical protein HHK36_007625 [Tetracentron sinense]
MAAVTGKPNAVTMQGDRTDDESDWKETSRELVPATSFGVNRRKRMARQRRASISSLFFASSSSHVQPLPVQDPSALSATEVSNEPTSFASNDLYFILKRNAAGTLGLSSLQKVTAAMRMLTYGVATDAVNDYVRIGESTSIESLRKFVRAVVEVFAQESAMKDVEGAFGVFQARFAIVRGPSRFWDLPTFRDIMKAYIKMHNMIIEDECDVYIPNLNYDEIDARRLRFLLQKELRNSDVGSLGRIVLPKRAAEVHLPVLSAKEGIFISMADIDGMRVWSFKYRFWPNNNSRMYVLENTGEFVRTHGLQLGDFIMLYRDDQNQKYVIRARKATDQDIYSVPDSEVNKSSYLHISFPTMDDTGMSFLFDNAFSDDSPMEFSGGFMEDYPKLEPMLSFGSVENLSLDDFL